MSSCAVRSRRPANLPALYRDFAEEAALLDALGFHSPWTAEHRLWYAGWCPALLHAAAAAVGSTTSLRFGNWAVVRATAAEAARIGADFRPLVQLDRLPAGIEAHWALRYDQPIGSS